MTLHSTLAPVSRHGDTGHRGQQCCSAAVLQRWGRGESCQNVHLQMIMKVVQLAVSCSAAGPGNSAQYPHCSIYSSTLQHLHYLNWNIYNIYTAISTMSIMPLTYYFDKCWSKWRQTTKRNYCLADKSSLVSANSEIACTRVLLYEDKVWQNKKECSCVIKGKTQLLWSIFNLNEIRGW